MKLQYPGDQLNRAVQARSTEFIGNKQAYIVIKTTMESFIQNKGLTISLIHPQTVINWSRLDICTENMKTTITQQASITWWRVHSAQTKIVQKQF